MPASEWKFWGKFWVAVSMLFVVALVAVIGVGRNSSAAKWDRAELDLINLEKTVRVAVSRDGGSVPEVTLKRLVDEGYLEDVPHDPWGNRYCLVSLESALLICTLGSDSAPGGTDAAIDLCVRQPGSPGVETNPPEARRCPR